jgi:hypothetical protein
MRIDHMSIDSTTTEPKKPPVTPPPPKKDPNQHVRPAYIVWSGSDDVHQPKVRVEITVSHSDGPEHHFTIAALAHGVTQIELDPEHFGVIGILPELISAPSTR